MKTVYFSFLIFLAGLTGLKAQNNILRSEPYGAGNIEQPVSSLITAHNNVTEAESQPPSGVTNVSQLTQTNLYPVPSSGNCTLTISSPATKKIKLNLVDESGKSVWQNDETLNSGTNSYNYSFTGKVPGVYMLTIQGENINEAKKLIIAE